MPPVINPYQRYLNRCGCNTLLGRSGRVATDAPTNARHVTSSVGHTVFVSLARCVVGECCWQQFQDVRDSVREDVPFREPCTNRRGAKPFTLLNDRLKLPVMNSARITGSLFTANFTAYLKNSKASFKVASLLFLLGFVLSTVPILHQGLALTASDFFNFQLWRLLSSHFVETNILILGWSLFSLYQASVILEPIWGHFELLKLFGIVQLITPFLISCMAFICYILTSNVNFYYYTYIDGFSAANAAVLVAMKQFLPDTIVLTTPMGRLKNTNLPLCALFACLVLSLFHVTRRVLPLQILIGLQVAWTYLRFYQFHPDENIHGDSSEHFAWHTLFPRRLQPAAKAVGKVTHRACITLRLCTPVRHIDLNQMQAVNVVLTGLETRDVERRRQKALRDLNERLSRMRTSPTKTEAENVPLMDDIDQSVVVTSGETSHVPESVTVVPATTETPSI
uniref:Transmembrane protein n=1 Tax=Steinernema glaseri TaxID=37863 RepID=A0A1I8AAU2_9BILA